MPLTLSVPQLRPLMEGEQQQQQQELVSVGIHHISPQCKPCLEKVVRSVEC